MHKSSKRQGELGNIYCHYITEHGVNFFTRDKSERFIQPPSNLTCQMTGRFYLAGVLVKTKCQNQQSSSHEPHSRGTSDLKHFVPPYNNI